MRFIDDRLTEAFDHELLLAPYTGQGFDMGRTILCGQMLMYEILQKTKVGQQSRML